MLAGAGSSQAAAVEAPALDRLVDVRGRELLRASESRDRPRNFENAVIGRAQAHGGRSCSSPRSTCIPALPFCQIRLKAEKPLPRAYPRELMSLADHLRKRRLDLGLRQKDVAEQLGMDETTVNNWERHRTRPAPPYLSTILQFLNDDTRWRAQPERVREIDGSPLARP